MSLTNLRSSQTLTNAALAGSLAAVIVWFGPPGTDFAAHVFQLHVYLQPRLRALDELLVRGPLHLRRLQPHLLPARRARRDPAARGDQRRGVGRRVHARRPPDLGRVDGLGDPVLRASSPPRRSSRPPSPTGSGSPSRWPPSSRSRAGRSRSSGSSPRSRSRRARSRSSSCSSCSPPPASRATRRGDREAGRRSPPRSARSAVLIWRLFPDHGRYPVLARRAAAALAFCALGVGAHLAGRAGADPARRSSSATRSSASLSYLIPSKLGENVVRLRYRAVPLALLACRCAAGGRCRSPAVAFALACAWNVSPLAWSLSRQSTTLGGARLLAAGRRYLHHALSPVVPGGGGRHRGPLGGRLPAAGGIPIVRGWFRQDDFPQNEVLYDQLDRAATWPGSPARASATCARRRPARLQRRTRDRTARERPLEASA